MANPNPSMGESYTVHANSLQNPFSLSTNGSISKIEAPFSDGKGKQKRNQPPGGIPNFEQLPNIEALTSHGQYSLNPWEKQKPQPFASSRVKPWATPRAQLCLPAERTKEMPWACGFQDVETHHVSQAFLQTRESQFTKMQGSI